MANIFGIQIGSDFVSTKKYEALLIKEENDFERYNKLSNSDLVKRYNELQELINSADFKKEVTFLKTAKYKETKQYRQLMQYKKMKKSADIKAYLKHINSGNADKINNITQTAEYAEFEELKQYINSAAFNSAKNRKDYKQSDAYSKEKRYKELLKNPDIKFLNNIQKSKDFKTIQKLENSERLNAFKELQETINSAEFIEHKTFMEDKNRFKNSEEASLIEEYNSLKKNRDIRWYLEKQKSNAFKEISKWELAFKDNFEGLKLNHDKWMTGYYWGKALMNESYANTGEEQIFKDNNIETTDSKLTISTKAELAKGKVWDPIHGFTNREFNYTSGLISTGQSFRQQQGRFEAKVRFSNTYPFVNAFWMLGEKKTPHIDIFKTTDKKGKKIECGIHITDKNHKPVSKTKMVSGAKFKNKFFIYCLEWNKDSLIWKINGKEVHREINHLPKEPMYISLCTILPETPLDKNLPANLDVDWVKCYKRIKG
ncbi:family 16 glycosylhydrolase [Marinilabiliaceae bacterium ANBcel2]|nr:family 16 glycosylhydrolase [Marinilabiliaceae bacterium ANBcel2]